jgi:ribose transport system substrate-binding protein
MTRKLLGGILVGAAAVFGCNSSGSGGAGGGGSSSSDATLPLVAFSQANSKDPWRQVFDSETKAAADKHSHEFLLDELAAEDDASKQITQIETFTLKQPKVLLVSPAGLNVGSETDKVFDSGVPVVLLDRAVPGDKYTCWIGGDNVEIGKEAADYIAKRLSGHGTVLMIQGKADASAAIDRRTGAADEFKKYPGITLIAGDDCKFDRTAAQNYMESYIQGRKPFDAVYAHNDEMAIGAYTAWETANKSQPAAKKPIFVGIDGCQKEMIDMIKDGKIDATFMYPIPGPKGVDVAVDLLQGKQPPSKKIVLPSQLVTKDNAALYEKENPDLAK